MTGPRPGLQMPALQHNNIQKPNGQRVLNDARRRGRGRLAFLKSGRTNNIAVVVCPQAPLPLESIAPPPSDAVQSRQWQAYNPSGLAGSRNARPAQPVAVNHEGQQFELDASRQAVHQLSDTMTLQGSPEVADRASRPEVYQLDGRAVTREAGSLQGELIADPLSYATITSLQQYPDSSIQRTAESTAIAEPVQPASSIGAEPMHSVENKPQLPSEDIVGFDCPIRAGPHGNKLCTWPPRRDIPGFPSLARVREHVGSHGLLCPDCDKVFSVPTRYRDHRKNKAQTGVCSQLGEDKRRFPKHIALPPDSILAFFVRPRKDRLEQDAWLDGYKILHPNWEHQGGLPNPFYKTNVASAGSPYAQDTTHTSHDSRAQPSSSTDSRTVGPGSNTQNTHYDVSPITTDGSDFTFDVSDPYPGYSAPGELNFTQMLNEMTWVNDLSSEHPPTDHSIEDTTFTMSGGLSGLVEFPNGENSGESTGTVKPGETAFPYAPENVATAGAGTNVSSQSQSRDTDVLDLSLQTSLPTSMQSSEAETNPYCRAVPPQEDRHDSAMELCETASSSGAEELVVNYLARSATVHGNDKQAIRPIVANTPARKKRIGKLMLQVEELFTKIQALSSENRSLHVKIGEVESEKQKLLIVLMKIRMEVDMCDLDDDDSCELDERIDLLNTGMQNIKLLLPD